MDRAWLDFNRSTAAGPGNLVYIRRSARTRFVSGTSQFSGFNLGSNFVAVNQQQWERAVAPVLEAFFGPNAGPLGRKLREIGSTDQLLNALGEDLKQSFIEAGYGPASPASVPSQIPFVPDDLENLTLWFDASDSATITLVGSDVQRWENKANAAQFHASQPIPGDRPELISGDLNGLDVIELDGTEYMTLPLDALTDCSLFVLAKYQTSATARGTFFAATGFDNSFGGPDGRINQDGSAEASGAPVTAVDTIDYPAANTLAADTYGIIEFYESIGGSNVVEIAVGTTSANEETVFTGDTTNDFWDPGRDTFGESAPILAAIGRMNAGINGAEATFDYLEGSIAEILFYMRVLSSSERASVRSYLRTKWGIS